MVLGVKSNSRGKKEVAPSSAARILGPSGMSECRRLDPTISKIEEAKTTHYYG